MIAFDFKDALSFEGETGPYVQYAVVRVNGILRKGAEMDPSVGVEDAANTAKLKSGEIDAGRFLAAPEYDDIWDLVAAGRVIRCATGYRGGIAGTSVSGAFRV